MRAQESATSATSERRRGGGGERGRTLGAGRVKAAGPVEDVEEGVVVDVALAAGGEVVDVLLGRVLSEGAEDVAERGLRDCACAALVEEGKGFLGWRGEGWSGSGRVRARTRGVLGEGSVERGEGEERETDLRRRTAWGARG